jgi:hypothetical protein
MLPVRRVPAVDDRLHVGRRKEDLGLILLSPETIRSMSLKYSKNVPLGSSMYQKTLPPIW